MKKEKIKFQIGVDVLGFPIYHYHELTFEIEAPKEKVFKNTNDVLPSKFIINRLYNRNNSTQKPK